MCFSAFLAQVIGWYLFLTSLAMLMNKSYFKKVMNEILLSPSLLTLSGALSIIFGLLITISHNVWAMDWRTLITLIGWLALLQGAFRYLFPEKAVFLAKKLQTKVFFTAASWVWLLIGLYLLWIGYTCCHC
jgi:hypothetical protein